MKSPICIFAPFVAKNDFQISIVGNGDFNKSLSSRNMLEAGPISSSTRLWPLFHSRVFKLKALLLTPRIFYSDSISNCLFFLHNANLNCGAKTLVSCNILWGLKKWKPFSPHIKISFHLFIHLKASILIWCLFWFGIAKKTKQTNVRAWIIFFSMRISILKMEKITIKFLNYCQFFSISFHPVNFSTQFFKLSK